MTKLMCLADLHLTEKKPHCRPDDEDWSGTVKRKLRWMSELAMSEQVDAVVIAGDIFDSVNRCSHEFMVLVLQELRNLANHTGAILAIPGNHDLVNADSDRIHQSPYGVLLASGVITPVSACGFGHMPYGATEYRNSRCSIVVGHYGLWYKQKPYTGAPDAGNVEWFVQNRLHDKCRLFITGHYHVPFVAKVKDTVVVNCGCPFRMRADLIDYKPTVTIANVSKSEVSVTIHDIPLDCKIRRDYIDIKKERDAALDDMVGNIEGDFEVGFNFKDNFYKLSNECENKDNINKEFERCVNGYY